MIKRVWLRPWHALTLAHASALSPQAPHPRPGRDAAVRDRNPLAYPESFTVSPYRVYLRPHLAEFLAHVAAHFDLAVWTASSADYAAVVVPATFGAAYRLEFVWARPRCTVQYDPETRERYSVKDLKKVRARGYALEHVLVVDDTPRKHQRNYGNLVSVRPFEGDLAER